jgi:hypothetical protein
MLLTDAVSRRRVSEAGRAIPAATFLVLFVDKAQPMASGRRVSVLLVRVTQGWTGWTLVALFSFPMSRRLHLQSWGEKKNLGLVATAVRRGASLYLQ